MNIICYHYCNDWGLWFSIAVTWYSDFFHRANNFVPPIQGEEGSDFLTVSGQPENNLSEDKELGSLVDNADFILNMLKEISHILSAILSLDWKGEHICLIINVAVIFW